MPRERPQQGRIVDIESRKGSYHSEYAEKGNDGDDWIGRSGTIIARLSRNKIVASPYAFQGRNRSGQSDSDVRSALCRRTTTSIHQYGMRTHVCDLCHENGLIQTAEI